MTIRAKLGAVLYAAAFCIALPLALVWWSVRLDAAFTLPLPPAPLAQIAGAVLGVLGLFMWLWGIGSLWHFGRGLPMNAFPPQRAVTQGAFAWFDHPIYVGFVAACFGVGLLFESSAAVWVVAPLTALACVSLLMGYETAALRARFPSLAHRPLARLPDDSGSSPTWRDRAAVYLLVYLPWLIVYEAVGHLPVPRGVNVFLGFETHWPVLPSFEPLYASVYLVVLAAPFCARTARDLRHFAVSGLIAIALVHFLYLVLPFIAPPRPIIETGILADLLALERADGLDGRAAFPSFHVVWSVLVAHLLGRRGWPVLAGVWSVGIEVSCVATGMHAVADVFAGFAAGVAIVHRARISQSTLRLAEMFANGWREWRLGPVRIINYALIAGLAAGTGVFIMIGIAGRWSLWWIGFGSLAALFGAAAWGLFWVGRVGKVGSSTVRPFGYFGSVLGGTLALTAAAGFRGTDDAWLLLASAAIAAPWIQAIGRVRCLINGCCHGKPCPDHLGIRYNHERSRVVRLSHLASTPLHPTPLYSIFANLFIGAFLWRLWHIGVAPNLVCAAYLIPAGLTRFVEEALRGEPHTPVYWGLRLYQWCAAALVFAGIGISMLPCGAAFEPFTTSPSSLLTSAAFAIIYACAMGVDFPESTRRLSRLT